MNLYPPRVVPTTSSRCLVPGCRIPASEVVDAAAVGARLAVPGTGMCLVHHARFPRILNGLVSSWHDLEHALYRRSGRGPENQKVQTSGISDLSSSWNPHATEVMADLTEWTSFLVRIVLADCPVPEPTVRDWVRTETIRDPHTGQLTRGVRQYTQHQQVSFVHVLTPGMATPLALAALAKHYARWLSSYPGDDVPLGVALLDDAIDFARRAMGAVQMDPVRRVGYEGMQCGEGTDEPGLEAARCESPMALILDGHGHPSALVCAARPNSHRRYEHAEWLEWAKDYPDAG